MDWVVEELQGIDLGDERLNKRTYRLVGDFFANASQSIPASCGGWAETQAAYRYFANGQVDWQKILSPHFKQTEGRIRTQEVVLCIQDTTELDFNGQAIGGMGRLSHDRQRGMYLHPTLVVTPDREALGVTDAWMWARGESKAADLANPAVAESSRWLEGYRQVAEMASRLPGTRLVYVADREADIGALIGGADQQKTPADWLIRSTHNRKVASEDAKLWDGFTPDHQVGSVVFSLPARDNQPCREVEQTLSVRRCQIKTKQGNIQVTAVLAEEENPPTGCPPVEWRLLTNRSIGNAEQVAELVDWYRARWEIEMFFHVLKTGCKVEALQLSTIDRVERALALYMLVAWRVLRLMRLGRTCPDLSCELFFSREEWQAAHWVARKPLPAEPPALNAMIRMVAGFGGFLGRKQDGEPGVKTLWTGLQRLMDFAAGIQAFREQQTCV